MRNVLPSAAKVEIEVLVPVSVLSRQGVTLYLVELATTSVDVRTSIFFLRIQMD